MKPEPVPAIRDRHRYSVPQPSHPVDLRLDGNEGPTPDRALLERLLALGPEVVRRYPNALSLEARLAKRLSTPAETVLVTAGADEALDRVCRAFLAPGRSIVLPEPGFEMLERYAVLAGAEIRRYPWTHTEFPVAAACAAKDETTAVVAIVSPNNPTGLAIDEAAFRAVAEQCDDALLLCDFAYADLADRDLSPVALEYPNAIVTRSLSKAFGLAGVRVGYACGSIDLIECLRAAGSPYSVAGPSLALAEEWLTLGTATVDRYLARIREERIELAGALEPKAEQVWPSQANFVLARFQDAEQVTDHFAMLGIAVRRFPNKPELADCVRITCPGNPEAFERVLGAVEDL